MTQTTDAALVAGSPATDSRGNFAVPNASELLDRMRHATDRTIGIGRGVRDMRKSSRTMPITVHELMYVEEMVAQAADTIEAQARRIEALEGDAIERCAKVVEAHGEAWGLSYRSMTDNLARAIRALLSRYPTP